MATTSILYCFYPLNPAGTPVDFIAEPVGVGPFSDAFDEYLLRGCVFQWLLTGEEGGNSFTKPIWHIGDGVFVDASGSEVNGNKHGIVITCSEPCSVTVGSYTRTLVAGENTIAYGEIGYNPESPETVGAVSFSKKSAILGIDFDNVVVTIGSYAFKNMTNLRYIKNMRFVTDGNYVNQAMYGNNKCVTVQAATLGTQTVKTGFVSFCFGSYTSALEKLDLRGFDVRVTDSGTLDIGGPDSTNNSLKEIDIRDLNTSNTIQVKFCNSTKLKKIIIGNFTNKLFSSKTGLSGSGKTLICTTTTPPELKNSETDDPDSGYSPSLDWLATNNGTSMFDHIYVPSSALSAYRGNTYRGSGTGWSRYANIIDDIANYDE